MMKAIILKGIIQISNGNGPYTNNVHIMKKVVVLFI